MQRKPRLERSANAVSVLPNTAYLAVPKQAGTAIVVLHAWWGLTRDVRDVCDRLAKVGHVAIAPDLFDGKLARNAEEAAALRSAPRRVPFWRKIDAAIASLRSHPLRVGQTIGVLGFSMGGHWALWLAGQQGRTIDRVVVFYAARASSFETGEASSFQFHFAETDPFVSANAQKNMLKRLAAAGREVEVHRYRGTQHWFAEPSRPEFDAAASEGPFEKMFEFFAEPTPPKRMRGRRAPG